MSGKIAIIPARSGSKGVKDKNIKLLNGKPLMAYSIETAIKSRMFDKVFVSTDSIEHANIAKEYGADASFLRSKELSEDYAGIWDVVKAVLQEFEKRGHKYDLIMLLQLFEEKGANAIESVVEVEHSPLWCNTLPEDSSMEFFERDEIINLPRQLLPQYYRINGAIYLLTREELYKERMFKEKCYAYVMPPERSLDIDTLADFEYVQWMQNSKLLDK